jgi:superfamily II DNA or RNA helicase
MAFTPTEPSRFILPVLRDYQSKLVHDAKDAVRHGARSVLLQLPTGGGKGDVAVSMAGEAVLAGSRVLYIVNRQELVRDVVSRFDKAGILCGVLMGAKTRDLSAPVVVASIATVHSREARPAARVVFADEAHTMMSDACLDFFNHYREQRSLVYPMTATPVRTDGRGLKAIADVMVTGPTTAELVKMGYLVPPRVFAARTPDLRKVGVLGGDYQEGQLGRVMDKADIRGDIVATWLRLAKGRPTVAFCVTKAHAANLAAEFRRSGVRAVDVNDSTSMDTRKVIWGQLRTGEIEVVCSVMLISYGWDCPPVSCAIMARPTKSEALYIQMGGRILRIFPGKLDAIVLDHTGNTDRHGSLLEDRNWTLEDRPPRQVAPGQEMKTCPECHWMFRGMKCSECGFTTERKERTITYDRTAEMVEVPFRPVVYSSIAGDEDYYAKIAQHGRAFGINFNVDAATRKTVEATCASGNRPGQIFYKCQSLQHLRMQHLAAYGELPPIRLSEAEIRLRLIKSGGAQPVPKDWWPSPYGGLCRSVLLQTLNAFQVVGDNRQNDHCRTESL